MEKDAAQVFRELKEDFSDYLELRLELLKLNTYERVARVIAVLSHGLILTLLVFFAILFLFLALGFLLSEWLGSAALGFVIVAGIYCLLLVIILSARNKIRAKVSDIIISAMMAQNEPDDEEKTDTVGKTDR